MRQLIFPTIIVLVLCSWRLVSSAPTTAVHIEGGKAFQSTRPEVQDEEQQLEGLKTAGKGIALVKSETQFSTNVNGKMKSLTEKDQKVQDPTSGKTMAQIHQEIVSAKEGDDANPDTVMNTVLDIPSKGIHRSSISRNGHKIQDMRMPLDNRDTSEEYSPYESVQYTPADMAEYIYKTGDEEGVTSALEELIREGLMSRDDAVSYLEDVKMNLEALRSAEEHARRMKVLSLQQAREASQDLSDDRMAVARRKLQPVQRMMKAKERQFSNGLSHSVDNTAAALQQTEELAEKRTLNAAKYNGMRRKGLLNENDVYDKELRSGESDQDYEDMMLERVRLADFLSKEFSLEEVIYQLAKQMFAQSILKGNSDTEEALQRFTAFLQEEANRGRISPELQRKVIGVMVAALADTVGEHPELAAFQPGPVLPDLPIQDMPTTFKGGLKSNGQSSSQAKEERLLTKNGQQEQLTLDKEYDHKTNQNSQSNMKSVSKKA